MLCKFLLIVPVTMIMTIVSCGLDLPPAPGVYEITSDCPDRVTANGSLEIPGLSDIASVFLVSNAIDFGFPSTVFTYALGGKVESYNEIRKCSSQIFERKAKNFIFLCREGSANICTIAGKRVN